MSLFRKILLLCLVLCLLFYLGYLFHLVSGLYEDDKRKDLPKIEFNNFVNWYKLNPKGWGLNEKTVYKTGAGVELRFSFFDTILYRFWRKRNEKDKLEKNNSEQMMEVLESVRKDIEKFFNK